MLVSTAESEGAKNVASTVNKQKKVQKSVFPKEDSEDIARVVRKAKKIRIKVSKKKQQIILEPPYLLIRARNIVRNEERLKQLEANKLQIKLIKDSLVKSAASLGLTTRIQIINKQGALKKMKCQQDHEVITGYNIEPDKLYCTNSGKLYSVSCVNFRRLFAEK